MRHEFIRRQLPVLLYGELTGWKRAVTDRHLRRCEECRREYLQLQTLRGLLSTTGEPPIRDEELRTARRALLTAAGPRRLEPLVGPPARARGPRRRVVVASVQALAGAAAGFAIATIAWSGGGDDRALLEGLPPEQLRIENVRFLEDEGAGQEVELSLETVRTVRVRGTVEDPEIQRLLARAILSEGNAGVRLRAVHVARPPSPDAVDPEIRRALLTAMTTDENAGVRMAALEVVRQLPLDRESRDALLHVILYDVNAGLRMAAIDALEEFMTEFTREDDAALRNHRGELESDDNAYVRWKARTVLLERGAL